MKFRIHLFWDVTLIQWIMCSRSHEGTRCFHLEDEGLYVSMRRYHIPEEWFHQTRRTACLTGCTSNYVYVLGC